MKIAKSEKRKISFALPVIKSNVKKLRTMHWTNKSLDAVVLFASGDTVLGVAEKLEVPPRTVRNWLNNEEFANAVLEERGKVLRQLRHKRLAEVTTIADRMFVKIHAILSKKRIQKSQLEKLRMLLHEYREYRNQEREEIGEPSAPISTLLNKSGSLTMRELIIKKGLKTDENTLKSVVDMILSRGYSLGTIKEVKELGGKERKTKTI